MKERFFAELSQILKKQQIETGPQQHGMLPVLCGGTPVFWVEPNGMQVHKADDVRSVKANKLFEKVTPISETVYEYVSLMKRAPLLQSDSGNQDYSLLADFNGVILAGKELGESGYNLLCGTEIAPAQGITTAIISVTITRLPRLILPSVAD